MRAWVLIALLGAGLSALALGTFAGLIPAGERDQVRFEQVLGTPLSGPDQASPPEASLKLVFAEDGRTIVSRQADGRVMAWDRASGNATLLAQTTGAFAYCAAKRRLVISNDAAVVALALEDGQFEHLASGKHEHAAFSGDCSTLALAAGATSEVKLIGGPDGPVNLRTSRPVRNGLSLSPTGTSLAAAVATAPEGARQRTGIQIFDLDNPEAAPSLVTDGDTVMGRWAMQFETTGRGLFVGSQFLGQGGLRRIDVASGELVWGYDGSGAEWVRGIAVGPNGTYLASGDDGGRLRLWDAESGVMLSEHKIGQRVLAMAFAPDGGLIAVALADGTIGLVPLGALF